MSRMRRISMLTTALAMLVGTAASGRQEPASSQPPGQRADRAPVAVSEPRFVAKEILVPVPNAQPQGLDVLEVYVDTGARHPLAVLTHGSSVKPEEHAHVTPWAQWEQALWFARRGYLVLVVVRKGYGRSGGEEDGRSGGCNSRGSFLAAGLASAEDLEGVIRWGVRQPQVDPETVLSVGVSTGGFAQVALSSDPPRGLRAAISFAGGRGSDGNGHNCDLSSLVGAFRSFGKGAAKHGPLPMLWIYSENDHFFPPAMATQFDQAYTKEGGADEFVMVPPNGEDGHHLYAHPDAWSETVTAFLKAHDLLPLGDAVLPPLPVPNIAAPAELRGRGVEGWQRFLNAAPYRAFAVSESGGWGFASGVFDQSMADEQALERCKKSGDGNGGKCVLAGRTPGLK